MNQEMQNVIPTTDLPPQNVADVQARIQAISHLESEITQLELDKKEMVEFYKHRTEQKLAAIENIKGQIAGYLTYHGRKNLATPKGTAYLKTVTSREWKLDDVGLLAWLENHGLSNDTFVRIKREPNKKAILEATLAHEELFTEHEHEELYVKKVE